MDKIAQGQNAQRILEDDTFKNARDEVYNGIVERMTTTSATDDEVLAARRELLALRLIENRLVSYINTGRMEEKRRDRNGDR